MTNEAVLEYETHLAVPFTVADGTGIEKGAILTMSDPMTAALCTTDGAIVAGVAKVEKIASNGAVKLAVFRGGIVKVVASGNITVGDAVITSAGSGNSNTVSAAAVNSENLFGTALETCTTGESLLVELNPRGINLA